MRFIVKAAQGVSEIAVASAFGGASEMALFGTANDGLSNSAVDSGSTTAVFSAGLGWSENL